jgi:hypothetical protein
MPHARTSLAILALLGLALAGCEKGMKIGPWQVLKAKHPLVATSFQLTRRHGTPAAATQAGEAAAADGSQRLIVDLNSGQATFTDTDGRAFPLQVEADRLEALRAIIADRTWQIGERGPAKGATDPAWYALTVYNGEKAVDEQAFWARPVAKEKKHPLPAGIATLEDALEHAQRVAHPISDTVDLLK